MNSFTLPRDWKFTTAWMSSIVFKRFALQSWHAYSHVALVGGPNITFNLHSCFTMGMLGFGSKSYNRCRAEEKVK